MDNQKFRLNLTIYHTNGGVMSPTTIVFSGARRDGLSKALALLTEAADGLWNPDEEAADTAARVQFHPPKSEYVNLHTYCLHLWKKIGGTFETPPKMFV